MMPRRRPSKPTGSLVEYGVIGDLHSAALVSRHGSIDWLCFPRLDSPSVFAALLDAERGGAFSIAPSDPYESEQRYVAETNLLETRFETPTGRAVLTDFMPVETVDQEEYAFQELHRILVVEKGHVEGGAEFAPRFDYGRVPPNLTRHDHGIHANGASHNLVLSSDLPFEVDDDVALADWSLDEGQRLRFILRYGTEYVRRPEVYMTDVKVSLTTAFWKSWILPTTFDGRWRDPVLRSALALKLLIYAPTGALAAAATTSLPETPGGIRNWDYRYSWVRDSAYAMLAFQGLGFTREARRYLRWLRRLLRGLTRDVNELRVLYGLEGETDLAETELPHLRGYLESRPVRIGNAAIEQVQHDVYGSLVAAIYESYRFPEGFPDEAWRTVRAVAEHIVRNWERPDQGIWEIRGPPQRYTHSAVMSWVALDRALKIAETRLQGEYWDRWGRERDRIHATILERAWNPRLRSFTQTLDGTDVDASLLTIPLVGFLPPDDPRVLSTMEVLDLELGDGPFLYRYRNDDGLPGKEGAFLLCSFWMVHALAMAGRVEDAQRRFDALSNLAGRLGLFSEEVDPRTLKALGNFPQALTHLAHINAALALHKALEQRPHFVAAKQ